MNETNVTNATNEAKVQRNYKDTFFRMLFKDKDNPELELTVTMYNVNHGYNVEIMEACRTLKEYAMYVERIRMYARQMPLAEAAEKAIDYCIEAGILVDFLRENRAEAIAMCLYEFNEEKYMKNEREFWYNTGIEESAKRLNQLHSILIDMGRLDDLKRATQDRAYQEQLMDELLPK